VACCAIRTCGFFASMTLSSTGSDSLISRLVGLVGGNELPASSPPRLHCGFQLFRDHNPARVASLHHFPGDSLLVWVQLCVTSSFTQVGSERWFRQFKFDPLRAVKLPCRPSTGHLGTASSFTQVDIRSV
jgi:hypothetical protein